MAINIMDLTKPNQVSEIDRSENSEEQFDVRMAEAYALVLATDALRLADEARRAAQRVAEMKAWISNEHQNTSCSVSSKTKET